MSVQSYPWTASVFKGEGRFLITTLVEHIGGYKTHADEVTIVSETEDDLVDKLGNKVLSRIKAVENSPLYVGKPKQFWKNGSKYKGYITFWKHNLLTYVDCMKTEVIEFVQLKNLEKKRADIMAA